MFLTDATTRVWLVMREIAITGSYWLGAPRTAQLASCSVPQVRRAWKKMQKVKLITCIGRHGDCGVKVWRINREVALKRYADLRRDCEAVSAEAEAKRGLSDLIGGVVGSDSQIPVKHLSEVKAFKKNNRRVTWRTSA